MEESPRTSSPSTQTSNPGTREDREFPLIPSSTAAEQAVLGCVMIDADYCMAQGLDRVQADWFFNKHRRQAWEAVRECIREGEAPDLVVLGTALGATGEAALELCRWADSVPSAAAFDQYVETIRELWQRRQLQAACNKAGLEMRNGHHGFEAGQRIVQDCIERVTLSGDIAEVSSLSQTLGSTMPQVAPETERAVQGALPTSVFALDELLGGGLYPGSFNILAARPSMGKTALAMKIGANVAKAGTGVLVFSLEMMAEELSKNLLSLQSGVNSYSIRRGRYPGDAYERVLAAARELEDVPLYICDRESPTIRQLSSIARRTAAKRKIGLIIVDYIQLVQHGHGGSSRDEKVAEISKGLKSLAKSLGLPILALSQLNREVDSVKRKDHRPRLSDLRESGSLEQDADVVAFLFRKGYYHQETKDEERPSGVSKTDVIVAKQRLGPIGTVFLDFNMRCGDFTPHVPKEEPVEGDQQSIRQQKAMEKREAAEDRVGDKPWPETPG